MEDKYLQYSIEDWVTDVDFIDYVKSGNSTYAEVFEDLSTHPKAGTKLSKAKKLILSLQSRHLQIPKGKLDGIYDKINQTIDSGHKESKPRLSIRWNVIISTAAAAMLLLIVFSPQFLSFGNQSITTEIGEQRTINLPDNSTVELNTGSTISFNEKKWEGSRKLALVGEAFFQVEKGSAFEVESNSGKVIVLGTEFNVYDRYGLYEVECLEGSVRVDLKNGSQYILEAGDKIQVKLGAEPEMRRGEVKEIDWLNDFVNFENIGLEIVLEEVARYYEVDIENFDDLENINYTGFFTTNNLDSAIYQILWPLNIDYTIVGNKVTIE